MVEGPDTRGARGMVPEEVRPSARATQAYRRTSRRAEKGRVTWGCLLRSLSPSSPDTLFYTSISLSPFSVVLILTGAILVVFWSISMHPLATFPADASIASLVRAYHAHLLNS